MEGEEPQEPPRKRGAKKGQFFGRRGKKRHARHLRKGQDKKDSETRRRYDDAIAAGAVPPSRSLAPPRNSNAAARRPHNSELQQSLRSKQDENIALQSDLALSTRRCSRLEEKVSYLAETVVAARWNVREARRETQQLVQEKWKIEEQLDRQEELIEAEVLAAVDAMKEKAKVRPCAC
jgi:septal ring factor EnvC (AmiA/AmiB activator)